MSNPAYKAVLDSSPSSNSAWDMMKEILLCKVSFQNDRNDRRVILYLNDCYCGRKYCPENVSSVVKNHLKKVTLQDIASCLLIEYKNQQMVADASLVGHIHLDKEKLHEMNVSLEVIHRKCEETLKTFGKKKKIGYHFRRIGVSFSDYCPFEQPCEDEWPASPCVTFFSHEQNDLPIEADIHRFADIIYPVLSGTIIKGDHRVSSANIIRVSPDSSSWIRAPSRNETGEFALDVVVEKFAVKQSGDAWRVVLDACLPVLPLIDTTRSTPYAIKQVQEVLGISCSCDQAAQRLSTSVRMVAKGVLKEHLILLANSMTCAGNLVGFNSGGYKALSRSLDIQVPFTEATLFTPRRCFEKAAEKCHTDSLSSVVASCSWGKNVALGTGSRFDLLWNQKEAPVNQEETINVYEFLNMVRPGANEKETIPDCLGADVDDLYDENEDWNLSPEHPSGTDKPVFEDSAEFEEYAENGTNGGGSWGGGSTNAAETENGWSGWGKKPAEPDNSNGWDNPAAAQKDDGNSWGAAKSSGADEGNTWSGWGKKSTEEKPEKPENSSGWNKAQPEKPENSSGWNKAQPDTSDSWNNPAAAQKDAGNSWGAAKSTGAEEGNTWSGWGKKSAEEKPENSSGWNNPETSQTVGNSWGAPKGNGADNENASGWGKKSAETQPDSSIGWNIAEEKPSSGWGKKPVEPDNSSGWNKAATSPKDAGNSWGVAKSTVEDEGKAQSGWGKKSVEPENSSGWNKAATSPKDGGNSWGVAKSTVEDEGKAQSGWGKKASEMDHVTPMETETNDSWGANKSKGAEENTAWSGWGKVPSKTEDQEKVPESSGGWGTPKAHKDTENSNWGKKTGETEKEKSWSNWGKKASEDSVSTENAEFSSPANNSGWGKVKSTENSQGWGSRKPDREWKINKNRPPKPVGTPSEENTPRPPPMFTATRQRLDLFTSDEQQILTEIEPLMYSIRRIMHKSGYNDGDPLSEADHTYVLDNVFNHHPEKDAKMGPSIDHFVINQHDVFAESKCFYVVSTDGSKRDFSYRKCLENYVKGKYPELAEEFIPKYFTKPRPRTQPPQSPMATPLSEQPEAKMTETPLEDQKCADSEQEPGQ